MQTKLPSFSESFTASVPLTRIRDIAHRNDIPSDLKREIKHTLQNKLHRNAGPEDLVATEAMLQRITAPGANYSGAFVHEFRVFTDELRDFFNASGLVTVLQRMLPSLQESAVTDVGRFLETKQQLDSGDEGRLVECMHQLTSVRPSRHLRTAPGLALVTLYIHVCAVNLCICV
jgi:phosphoglucan, water dikinase